MNDYQKTLEAMGFNVIAFETFGSYQGNWAALVDINGKLGVIADEYGSCSGCDSYEGHFQYEEPDQKQLREFGEGMGYEPRFDIEDLLFEEKWDCDHNERANWIREQLASRGK